MTIAMSKPVINLSLSLSSGVAAVISLCANWYVATGLFVVFMCIFFFRALKENQLKGKSQNKEIHETNQTLKSGLIETHMRLNELTHSQQAFKQGVIRLLVEAASHLGNPPPSGRVVQKGQLLAWNNNGIALVAKAKALIEAELAAHPWLKEPSAEESN